MAPSRLSFVIDQVITLQITRLWSESGDTTWFGETPAMDNPDTKQLTTVRGNVRKGVGSDSLSLRYVLIPGEIRPSEGGLQTNFRRESGQKKY